MQQRVVAIMLMVACATLFACGGANAPEAPPPASADAEPPSNPDEEGEGATPPPIEIATPESPSGLVNGGPAAATKGAFGPVFPMPLIPIHMVMLPDARILAYGSDEMGVQSARLHYMVYDPEAAGYPFLVLPSTTNTDVFCSAQVLLPQDGRVLLAGGDRTLFGVRNFATSDVNIFNPSTGKLELQSQPMNYRRWYATGVITAQGDYLVLGGRDDRMVTGITAATYATTPEIYNPVTGWRALPDARSDAAFGNSERNWWYPKAWVAPNGRIAVVTNTGGIYQVDPEGRGSILPWATATGRLAPASATQPAVMYKPGKILAARRESDAQVIDINGPSPTVQNTSSLSVRRTWGSLTLLPDGRVWANGGSADGRNELNSAVYSSELWNPETGNWTLTAPAARPRLYHGNAILLRDGRVLTGGGGAPGPVAGLNGEIFYPPYLFRKDGSGQLASRPVVSSVSSRALPWSAQLTVRMSTENAVPRVVMLRTGSATHSFNGDQRLLELPVTQNGRDLSLTMPASRNNAPPGYYIVFVLDADGVPSVGEIIKLG